MGKMDELFKDGASPTIPEEQDPFAGITEAPPAEEEGADAFFGNGAAEDKEFSDDFTGETAGTRLAPEGLNKIRCTNIDKSTSKRGDPMYVWDFVIIDGDGKGITLKLFTSLASSARWKVIETLEGLGIAASDRVVRFKASDVKGKVAYANIVHETYQGRVRNVIQQVMTEADAITFSG